MIFYIKAGNAELEWKYWMMAAFCLGVLGFCSAQIGLEATHYTFVLFIDVIIKEMQHKIVG